MEEIRKVYLDNAATTPMIPEVIEVMHRAMQDLFGNPSSIHSQGRQVRSEIEKARRKIAAMLHCTPSELFFTSGGTEADNMALQCTVRDLGVTRIISTGLEHHAILHTLEHLADEGIISLVLLETDNCGRIDYAQLEALLAADTQKTLVTLMHANNETGTLLDLQKTAEICKRHKAWFHSDTVQTIGHYEIDLSAIPVDFISCAAHKFHGPKGTGFIFIRNTVKVKPFIFGGAQERNMRGGTENIYGILGMTKALELSLENLSEHQASVEVIKSDMLAALHQMIPGISVNGCLPGDDSLYTVLNIALPESDLGDMLLFNLDIAGVAASGGSACSSGSDIGSHVLRALGVPSSRPCVRFSFSRLTTREDTRYAVARLAQIAGIRQTEQQAS